MLAVIPTDNRMIRYSKILSYSYQLTSNFVFCSLVIICLGLFRVPVVDAGEREDYTFAYKLYEKGAYTVAKDQFETFIQKYPDSENYDDARLLIGESALNLERYDVAIQNFKRLTAEHPNSSLRLDAVRGIATAWFRQGKYTEAIKGFQEFWEAASKDVNSFSIDVIAESIYLTGESYEKLGLYQKAREYYDQVLKDYPQANQSADALYSTAWVDYRLKKFKQAHDQLLSFVEQYPDHYATIEATYRAAESLFQIYDWPSAQVEFEQFIAKYQDHSHQKQGLLKQYVVDARFRLGECYFQQQMMNEARDTFAYLLHESEKTSISAEAQYWIGEILAEEGKGNEAIHEYQKVIRLYPDSAVSDNAQYGIAMVYFDKGLTDSKGYTEAKVAFKLVADNLKSELSDAARFRMGECFRLSREFNSAILNYNKVGGNSPYEDDAQYQIAISYFELRDYQSAASVLKNLLVSAPETDLKSYVLYHLGLSYFNLRQYSDSASAFDGYFSTLADRDLPTASADEALYWKARALFEAENYSDGIATCNTLVQTYPDSQFLQQAEFFIAESTYWQEGSASAYQSARQKYQDLLKKGADKVWAEKYRFGIGWTYFSEAVLSEGKQRNKLYEQAIMIWREMIQKYPSGNYSDQAQYHQGVAQSNLKHYRQAIKTFSELLQTYESSNWRDDAQYQIGWAYYKLERYSDAVSAFRKQLQAFPASQLEPKAIFGIANAYFKLGKYTNAITEYRRVIDNFPNLKVETGQSGVEKSFDLRPEAQYYVAESYVNLRNYQYAIQSYGKVIEHYPKSVWADDAQYGIATAYEDQGDNKQALHAYQQLIKYYPSSALAPDVQIHIGRFYFTEKNYSRAISEFQKVIEQYENSESSSLAQYHIGKSYLEIGSFKQAISAFQKVSEKSKLAATARYEAGYTWYNKKNPGRNLEKAIDAFLVVARQYPKSNDAPRALLLAGYCNQELLRWNKAAEIYQKILNQYSESEQSKMTQLLLGHVYRSQKQYASAISAYTTIRDGGTDQYPVEIVIDAELRLAETLSLNGQHYEAGSTYLRVRHLREQHNPLTALHAAIRAADAYAKAKKDFLAKDGYEDAISLYQTYISSVNVNQKKDWEQLHQYAAKMYQELLRRTQ